MANSVLPARLGEVIRPVMIARKEKIKISVSIATVVMERIFDILGIIVMASLLFCFLPSEPSQNRDVAAITYTETSAVDSKTEGQDRTTTAILQSNKQMEKTDSQAKKNKKKKWSAIMAFLGICAITTLFLL